MFTLLEEYQTTIRIRNYLVSCGCNVIKRKHQLSKKQRKKINFICRLKYAKIKIFCICVDVLKIQEENDYDKLFEVLSTLKNKKIKKIILIEKYISMLKNYDFEQHIYSKTAVGI